VTASPSISEATIVSIALQPGAPLDVLRKALLRDSRGIASGLRGTARDLIADNNRRD
jgi:hypothetical protein